jgi:hypothetical protein
VCTCSHNRASAPRTMPSTQGCASGCACMCTTISKCTPVHITRVPDSQRQWVDRSPPRDSTTLLRQTGPQHRPGTDRCRMCALSHPESHANGGWGTLPAAHVPAVTWPAHLARHQQPMHHMLGTLPQRAAPQALYAGVPHVCQGCEGAALHSAGHMVCPASPIPLPHPPPVATASWLQPPGNLCSVLPPGQGVPALRPGPLAAQL